MGLSYAVPSRRPSRLAQEREHERVVTGRKAPKRGRLVDARSRRQGDHQRRRKGWIVREQVKVLATWAMREVDWHADGLPKAALGEDATPAGVSGRRETVGRTVADLPMQNESLVQAPARRRRHTEQDCKIDSPHPNYDCMFFGL